LLAKAEGNADFLIGNPREVWRQCWIESTPIVKSAASDGDLQEPVTNPFPSTARIREPPQQARHVRHVP
jgi:hypothetical protein